MIYLDTSVLVSLYVPEALSHLAQQRLFSASTVTVSELAQTEFVAALSLRLRNGELTWADARRVVALFFNHVGDNLYLTLHLNRATYRLARDYIARFDLPLKTPDALHLAAAALEQLPLVTADRQLARNAEALGIDAELLEL